MAVITLPSHARLPRLSQSAANSGGRGGVTGERAGWGREGFITSRVQKRPVARSHSHPCDASYGSAALREPIRGCW